MLAEDGKKFTLTTEEDGTIRTDLFTLDSRVTPIKNCQLKSPSGKIFDIKIDGQGVIHTEENTVELNILQLETQNFKITIDDEGILITTQK
jgi:hypothetical protein